MRGANASASTIKSGGKTRRAADSSTQVAHVRFASVYKDFQAIGDFEREFGLLLHKRESKACSR
jgi:transcriptional regulator NrdR family protein